MDRSFGVEAKSGVNCVRPLEQEVYLSLVRAFELFSGDLTRLCREHGISPFQLNVLRILRGAGEQGLPCLSIADRMLNRIPDMTRMIDRLEAMGLVTRSRTAEDRRVVLVRLTIKGRDLLARLDQPLVDMHMEHFSHMDQDELFRLYQLLQKAQAGQGEGMGAELEEDRKLG